MHLIITSDLQRSAHVSLTSFTLPIFPKLDDSQQPQTEPLRTISRNSIASGRSTWSNELNSTSARAWHDDQQLQPTRTASSLNSLSAAFGSNAMANNAEVVGETLFQRRVLALLHRILEEVTSRRDAPLGDIMGQQLGDDFSLFPLSKVEDWDQLNVWLSEKVNLSRFKRFLQNVGGNNVEEKARRILNRILMKDVSNRTSWMGSGGEKRKFCGSAVQKAVFSVLRGYSNFNGATVEKTIKEWVKQLKRRKN